jgi:hypothetical protein
MLSALDGIELVCTWCAPRIRCGVLDLPFAWTTTAQVGAFHRTVE